MAGFVDVDRTRLQKAVFAPVFSKGQRRSQQKRHQQQMSEHAIDNSKNGRERPVAVAPLQSSDRSRTLSDLLFNGCNTFRLDICVVAEPGQPMHIRFSPEPCDLALGIVAMRLLRRDERRLAIQFAAQKLQRLFVSQRRERARLRAIFCEQSFRLGNQSLVKHVRGSLVDARIKNFAIRTETETPNAKATKRFASL